MLYMIWTNISNTYIFFFFKLVLIVNFSHNSSFAGAERAGASIRNNIGGDISAERPALLPNQDQVCVVLIKI